MVTALFVIIIAFSFFAQSILGFGSGLIAVPLLILFMPVQDAVTVLILFEFLIGLLIFKTHKNTAIELVNSLVPAMVIGTVLGILSLKYISEDAIRLIFAGYIIFYLLRNHTSFDPFKIIIDRGGALFAGLLGGGLNGMISGGGPAFVLYLKEQSASSVALRANVTAILFVANIPRIFGSWAAGLLTVDLVILGATAIPAFLLAIVLGQKLHHKIPQKIFYVLIEALLVCTALSLIINVAT